MPLTPYLIQDLRRMAFQCAGLPDVGKADFLELLDLAEAALVRRAADAARAAACRKRMVEISKLPIPEMDTEGKRRFKADRKRSKPSPRRPLEAVGKEAPAAPKLPTNVPVAKDDFQKPTVLPHGLDGNANFVSKPDIVKPILVPTPIAAILSRLPTAKKVDLTSPQS